MVKVTAGLPLLNSNKYINIGLWKGISLWLNSDLAETVTGFTKAAIKILIRHLRKNRTGCIRDTVRAWGKDAQ